MKNITAQIILAIIFVLATLSQSCGGSGFGDKRVRSPEQEKEVHLNLRKLQVEQEGIKQDEYYVYSTKCWISAMENIAMEFASDGAKEQLDQFCSNSKISFNDTKSQSATGNSCVCVKLILPKQKCF
ncbi:MAG: hypothetical protein ACOYUZ_01915 [Patescibacteria group bacterium]